MRAAEIKRISLTILVLIALTAAACGETSPRPPKIRGDYLHKASGTTFHAAFDGLVRTGIVALDRRSKGVCIKYIGQMDTTRESLAVSVYPALDGTEGRLLNEFRSSMREFGLAHGSSRTTSLLRHVGDPYICNGMNAMFRGDSGLVNVSLYECGTWFLKIVSTASDTSRLVQLRDSMTLYIDPSRLTAREPLSEKADMYLAPAGFRDSIMLGSVMGSALAKVNYAAEHISRMERASGFPDIYLELHMVSLVECLKFSETHPGRSTELTEAYLSELNRIRKAGYWEEMIMKYYEMNMIVPDHAEFDFGGYDAWISNDPLDIDLDALFYVVGYSSKRD